MALTEFLILRKPRSGCLEERTVLIQPIGNSFTRSITRVMEPGEKPRAYALTPLGSRPPRPCGRV